MPGTNIKGILTTYGQIGEYEDLADMIRDASGYDTPLFSFLPRGKSKSLSHDWIEDSRRKSTTTLASNFTTSAPSMAVADGKMFVIGDLVRVDSEVCRITNISGSTLTVTRSWGSTVTTTHASGATVVRLGFAGVAGADAPTATATLKVRQQNWCQEFVDTVLVSFEERGVRNVGGDEFDYQVAKRMKEHAVAQELSILYGARNAGSASSPPSSGGLSEWLTTNTGNVAGTLSQQGFESRIRNIYTNAGADKPDVLVVSPIVMEAILFWARGTLRTTISEKKTGVEVNKVMTPYGTMDVLLNRHVVSGEFFALQSNLLKWCPLVGDHSYNTKLYPLARTGTFDKAMIHTIATLERANEYAHARYTGVTGGA